MKNFLMHLLQFGTSLNVTATKFMKNKILLLLALVIPSLCFVKTTQAETENHSVYFKVLNNAKEDFVQLQIHSNRFGKPIVVDFQTDESVKIPQSEIKGNKELFQILRFLFPKDFDTRFSFLEKTYIAGYEIILNIKLASVYNGYAVTFATQNTDAQVLRDLVKRDELYIFKPKK